LKAGVPKESADGERRVTLVPEVVRKLGGTGGGEFGGGIDAFVERGSSRCWG
jgi:alanine dehydrogenase